MQATVPPVGTAAPLASVISPRVPLLGPDAPADLFGGSPIVPRAVVFQVGLEAPLPLSMRARLEPMPIGGQSVHFAGPSLAGDRKFSSNRRNPPEPSRLSYLNHQLSPGQIAHA